MTSQVEAVVLYSALVWVFILSSICLTCAPHFSCGSIQTPRILTSVSELLVISLSCTVAHGLLNEFDMSTYLDLIPVFPTAPKAGRSTVLRRAKSLTLRQFAVCFLSI